jgi:hypothetical protein
MESPATLYEEISAFPVAFVLTGGTSSLHVRLKPNFAGPCATAKFVESFDADVRKKVTMATAINNVILKIDTSNFNDI